jgi:hypothetical protein
MKVSLIIATIPVACPTCPCQRLDDEDEQVQQLLFLISGSQGDEQSLELYTIPICPHPVLEEQDSAVAYYCSSWHHIQTQPTLSAASISSCCGGHCLDLVQLDTKVALHSAGLLRKALMWIWRFDMMCHQ